MQDAAVVLNTLKEALGRQDRSAVNAACRSLIAMRARLGGQWRSLIFVLIRNGEMSLARAAADTLAEQSGNSALGRFEQAATYARTGRLADARAKLEALPDSVPDPVGNAYIRGTLSTNLGEFETARTHLRRAVGLAPGSGQSWLALSMVGRVSTDDAAAMRAAEPTMRSAAPAERGAYHYAMGKMFDEQGNIDAAFDHFARGAEVVQTIRAVEMDVESAAARSSLDGWHSAEITSLAKPRISSSKPIFVTGLPRSGTTLVEQILASHSAVQGGEELGCLSIVAQEAGGTDVGTLRQLVTDGRLDEMANLYAHLIDERFPKHGRVIDKTLLGSRFMGLIATVLPDAPIIWLRRDPLDNAWSVFRTYFLQDLGWTFDLAAIGRQMALEDQLFAYWSKARPDRILAVDYADLARDPTAIIPKIVAHCGLMWEPQQLHPHQHRRAVTTASVAQVRAPIGTQAIGAAEPYRRHLQPFIDAYRAAGGDIG